MKRILPMLLLLVCLLFPMTNLNAQHTARVSNSVSITLRLVVPERTSLSVQPADPTQPGSGLNPYVATVNLNLLPENVKLIPQVGVEYQGTVYYPTCPENVQCIPATQMATLRITIPFHAGPQTFALVGIS